MIFRTCSNNNLSQYKNHKLIIYLYYNRLDLVRLITNDKYVLISNTGTESLSISLEYGVYKN